jgi:hypothetical protein
MKVELVNEKEVEIGGKFYPVSGEANWFWACKSFNNKDCENKSVGHYVLKDEGISKVLAFKRLVEIDDNGYETELPDDIKAVKNPDLLHKLNLWDAEQRGDEELKIELNNLGKTNERV